MYNREGWTQATPVGTFEYRTFGYLVLIGLILTQLLRIRWFEIHKIEFTKLGVSLKIASNLMIRNLILASARSFFCFFWPWKASKNSAETVHLQVEQELDFAQNSESPKALNEARWFAVEMTGETKGKWVMDGDGHIVVAKFQTIPQSFCRFFGLPWLAHISPIILNFIVILAVFWMFFLICRVEKRWALWISWEIQQPKKGFWDVLDQLRWIQSANKNPPVFLGGQHLMIYCILPSGILT